MNRFNNVIFGQKAFLINEKHEILVLKRKTAEVYLNYWDVPGGKLEEGNDLVDSLAREIREETGLELGRIVIVLSTSKFTGTAGDNPIIFRNIYLATASGQVKLSGEHSEYRWVAVSELAGVDFPPDPDFQAAVLKLQELFGSLDLGRKYSLVI